VAVYLLYVHPHDPTPSAYIFEAGLATGGPRVPFYSADIAQPIPKVPGQYAPTPMSSASEIYQGQVTMDVRRLKGFGVQIRDQATDPNPKVTVFVTLENTDLAPTYINPADNRLEAAERVALIAMKLGVPFSGDALTNVIAGFLAIAGTFRPWDTVPG
jgi:hypothetical protein